MPFAPVWECKKCESLYCDQCLQDKSHIINSQFRENNYFMCYNCKANKKKDDILKPINKNLKMFTQDRLKFKDAHDQLGIQNPEKDQIENLEPGKKKRKVGEKGDEQRVDKPSICTYSEFVKLIPNATNQESKNWFCNICDDGIKRTK